MLIFNSWRSQAIDRMRKNALRRGRGTTLRSFGVGSGVRDLAGRWQGDAEGGEREGGGGTRGGAQQEALAVLFRAPELNPVENVWQFMRGNWLSNLVFDTYDDIIDAACDAWRKLTAQPATITSIGMREWAHVGQTP